jgi:acyl carrier protein
MSKTINLDQTEVQNVVSKFIKETYLYWTEDFDLQADHSLMGGGIVDSTGILELAAFIESTFGITINDDEFVPENLDTLNAIGAFILRKSNGHLPD